jgi:hypothetical protein
MKQIGHKLIQLVTMGATIVADPAVLRHEFALIACAVILWEAFGGAYDDWARRRTPKKRKRRLVKAAPVEPQLA